MPIQQNRQGRDMKAPMRRQCLCVNLQLEDAVENELFTRLTHVLEATVIQLIAKCFQSLVGSYLYMCIYISMDSHVYIHTHIYMLGRDAL